MDKQTIITFYYAGIEVDFDNIYSYCKFTEAALRQETERFLTLHNEKVAKLSPDEKRSFDQLSIEIPWKLYDVFPTLQWTSIFNSAYSLFERYLNDLCGILAKNAATKIELTDLTGQGVERAKIFLSKIVGITNVFNSTEWKNIQDYSKIRNILVHASGKLDLSKEKHKKIFEYAKTQKNLIVSPEDPESLWAQVTILPEYIYDSLLSYRILLGKICTQNLEKTTANNAIEADRE